MSLKLRKNCKSFFYDSIIFGWKLAECGEHDDEEEVLVVYPRTIVSLYISPGKAYVPIYRHLKRDREQKHLDVSTSVLPFVIKKRSVEINLC